MELIVGLAFLAAVIYGGIKTFKRNWILALALFLLVTPIWAGWAIVECFTDDINAVSETTTTTIDGDGNSVTQTVIVEHRK